MLDNNGKGNMDEQNKGLSKESEILKFQVERLITQLFKDYLVLAEDIADEHDIAMKRLIAKLPAEFKDYVELADYLDDARFDMLRRKILGKGNDCKRAISDLIEGYEIKVKK